jgi:hypothetical protein
MYDRLQFVVQDVAKPDIENIRGLNLAVVNLTNVQVTMLQKEELFNNMSYVRHIHLTKKEEAYS